MSGFTINIAVDDRVSPALARLVEAGGHLAKPMTEVAEVVLSHTQERFHQEYSPDGVPWLPSRAAIEEGRHTLFKGGYLFDALEDTSGDDFAAVGVQATGGPARYAAIHQFGGTIRPRRARALKTPFGPRGSVTMPARPFLGIEERDLTAIDAIVIEHLRAAALGPEAAP